MPRSRTAIRRHPERALAIPDDAEAILRQGVVAHVGIVEDGQPVVIPLTYLYHDGRVYLHGAPGSRIIKAVAGGGPVCIEVTLVDALIFSKSAETHSINYRSAVLFGRGRPLRDRARERELLEALIARYFPGRTAGADYAHVTEPELKATRLVEVTIEEMSAKGRSGGPRGDGDADPAVPGSAGVHPLTLPHA